MDEDPARRIAFCEEYERQYNLDNDLHRRIIFTDETAISQKGINHNHHVSVETISGNFLSDPTNGQNHRQYSEMGEGRPAFFKMEKPSHARQYNVWLGARGDGTKLPIYKDWGTINAEAYCR